MRVHRNLRLVVASLSAVVIAALGVGGCKSAPAPKVVSVTEEPWSFGRAEARKLVTEHFDIYTTLTDVELRAALPAFLEAAHEQYVSLLPPPAGEYARLQTYVFDNRNQWERFARERFPKRFRVYQRISAGGFASGNLCVVYYLRRTYTLSVLAHEGMHQYFANHFDVPLPAWLNEGMATYCESFELPRGRPVFTPQRNTFRINGLREALSTQTVLPLQQMLATDAGEVILQGQSRLIKTYYAQAWAMAVFIRHGAEGRYAAGFDRLLADIVSGDLPQTAQAAKIRAPSPSKTSYGEAVFRAYITEDLETFERDFETYLYQLAGFRKPDQGG